MAQIDPVELRTVLTPYFVSKNEFYDPFLMYPLAISSFLGLPALRGFWLGSSQYESSSAVHQLVDLSGCGQHLTDTHDPLAGHIANGAVYIKFDGTNDWYSASDSAHWDITGTEGAVRTGDRGMTIGAWVNFDDPLGNFEYILSKRQASGDNQTSYALLRDDGGPAQFHLSSDGTLGNTVLVESTADIAQSAWTFVVGRFDPSTQMDIFVNGDLDTNTTSIPANIFASTADLFMAGRDDAGTPGQGLMDGAISMAFICAAYINDYTLIRLYELSRIVFGVD